MALVQWRRLNFFDKEILRNFESNEPFDKLKDINLSASSCGRGQIVLGDVEGFIFFVDRRLKLTAFKAYEIRITHLYQLKQHNILVSIGEDEDGINPLIKVWNLDKRDRADNPMCTRIARAIPGSRPSKVSCLTVHENLTYMAVGFDNGSIVLFRGDVMRERHSKQKVIFEGQQRITGLNFKTHNKNQALFVATEGEIICITLLPKDKEQKTLLDLHGCSLRCSVMSDVTQYNQFVIGRPDAVYFYQPEERGPCLAFESEKLQLHWYHGYMIIVGKENQTVPRVGDQSLEMNILTIYDIQNKFIAYSAPFPLIFDIFCEWGSLYILTKDRKLFHLQEKDTQTKLEILFKKNLYVLAIGLAQSQQYDQDGIVDIFRQYGDHLYSKGDYDGAITQYIKTISKLEASYVIRKFLDTPRIHNLTAYLQALHKAQLATEDHTTLLLNCYTKLKDTSKLDEFIMKEDREVDFDMETAIKVCRSAGYFQHAIYLAERHNQHDSYLKIQLEDVRDYARALDYIGKLDFDQAERNMKKYGKVLISEAPRQTTELLKKLCTDYRPCVKKGESSVEHQGVNAICALTSQSFIPIIQTRIQKSNADEFIHIFVNNSDKLTEFLEHMIKVQPGSSPLVYNTLLELYLHDHAHEKDISAKVDKERKILDLLQNPDSCYDLDQALVLCQLNNFKAGILFLYEKAKLYHQILRYHMEHNENPVHMMHIMETCKRFGSQDPNLWIQALSYFARKEDNCKQQILEVLSQIDKCNLLPPLLVVQTLAHNSLTTLSVVKDYIVRHLQLERDEIEENERLIRQYREDTEKMRNEIDQLKTSAKIFQNQKCSLCSQALDLPSVHFLCQHSFHHSCFDGYSDSDAECPICLPRNRQMLETIRAQEQSKDLHEQFHQQLERASDGFSVIADYYGRGVFNKVTFITEPSTNYPVPSRETAPKSRVPPKSDAAPSYPAHLSPFDSEPQSQSLKSAPGPNRYPAHLSPFETVPKVQKRMA